MTSYSDTPEGVWFFVVDCRGHFEGAFPRREQAESYVLDLSAAFGEGFTILEKPRDTSFEVLRREGLAFFKALPAWERAK